MSEVTRKRSWVIYGRSGTGKTTLAGSFPGPALLVDIKDEGTDSVSDVKGLMVTEVEEWDELEEILWFLRDNPKKFKTVIFDTITQAQMLIVNEIAGAKAIKAGKAPGDWGTMTKQQWGEVSSRMKNWITNIRDLDIEVVFIAQERAFNFEEDEGDVVELDPEVGPRLSPSVMSHLCAACSVIVNTFIRSKVRKIKKGKKTIERHSKEYCIRLGPSSYYITKVRKPKSTELPDFLEDPTYEDILEIIKGED